MRCSVKVDGAFFHHSMNDKNVSDGASPSRNKSYSLSSHAQTVSSSAGAAEREDRAAQREVRTLPSENPMPFSRMIADDFPQGWIHSVTAEELSEDVEVEDPEQEIPSSPKHAQLAQHNHTPFHKHRPEPGRLHDAARERTPLIPPSPVQDQASRWQTFAKASAYPPVVNHDRRRVDEEWLMEHMPDLDAPWHVGGNNGDLEKGIGTPFTSRSKRAAWYTRLQVCLLFLAIVVRGSGERCG